QVCHANARPRILLRTKASARIIPNNLLAYGEEGRRGMSVMKRFKTQYPGVYYIESRAIGWNDRPERIYYVVYRKDGKLIEEKAGRQLRDAMTPAKAAQVRAFRINGLQPSNRERREMEKERKKPKWTIGRLWEEYKRQNSLKGLAQDESRFKHYLAPQFKDKEPQELVPFDVDRLRVKLLKVKSPQTVMHVLTLLRRIVLFGVRKGLCGPLAFTIQMPKVHNLRSEDLTLGQLERLLEAIDTDPDEQAGAIMKMVLFSGMRRGEMFNLRWKDVDFDRGFILIRDSKGGPNQRIPLNEASRQLLQGLRRTDSPYVVPGQGARRRAPSMSFGRIRTRAGLPKDFRPLHGLRHAYASMLASSGQVDMYTLQKLLTHKSPEMTQRYAHLRDEALKKASSVADDLINGI
ncbi:MAG: tyrosine-type recombinase/integrase, partial [Candidatus Hodarchaeota archaeon]